MTNIKVMASQYTTVAVHVSQVTAAWNAKHSNVVNYAMAVHSKGGQALKNMGTQKVVTATGVLHGDWWISKKNFSESANH